MVQQGGLAIHPLRSVHGRFQSVPLAEGNIKSKSVRSSGLSSKQYAEEERCLLR